MAKILIQSLPKIYIFIVNSSKFICEIEYKDESNKQSVDILIDDLKECSNQLEKIKTLSNDNSKDKKI